MHNNYFVLVADVKDSRGFDYKHLNETLNQTRTILSQQILFHLPPVISLGDELQMAPASLQEAVMAIRTMEEFSLKTSIFFRYALSYGELEGNRSIIESAGSALIQARKMIEFGKREENYKTRAVRLGDVNIQLASEHAGRMIETVLFAMSSIRQNWKPKYHQLAIAMIDQKSDAEIAKTFNFTTSAIWKRRRHLDMDSYIRLRNLLKSMTDKYAVKELLKEVSLNE